MRAPIPRLHIALSLLLVATHASAQAREQPCAVPPPAQTVFAACQVDTVMRWLGPRRMPVFPELLASARVPGEVAVQLVVLADGRMDEASVHVLNSTHALFTQSVLDALLTWTAHPAMRDGRRVDQVVLQVFEFRISPPEFCTPRRGSIPICVR